MSTKASKDKTKSRRKIILERLIFDLIVFLILLSTGTLLLVKSFNFETEKIVKYNENSHLDYKVYLQKNDFYEQEYLGKDMLYVASLIDKILVDFDYKFVSEDEENIDFTYSVYAKLSISNPAGTKAFFEKTYPLLKDKKVSMANSNHQEIKEQISVDYPYYNQLANNFKNQYGIDADSKLTVFMLINKKNGQDSSFYMDNNSVMNVVIPVSERAVDIRLDYKEINETSNIVKKRTMTIKDYLPLVLSVIFILLSLVMMIKAMRNIGKLHKKKTPYNKYITKILKEYDRLIAESETLLSSEGKEIIKINKFTELLDIHDNLQLPIMYYEVKENKLSYFYINHQNIIYLLSIDADELNNQKK